jgi:hypothetical protein
MKISYTHPETHKRTSITLNDRILRLWAICNHIDVIDEHHQVVDDFLDKKAMSLLKLWLHDNHEEYLKNTSNFPTFVSYFENIVLLDVEHRLTRPM